MRFVVVCVLFFLAVTLVSASQEPEWQLAEIAGEKIDALKTRALNEMKAVTSGAACDALGGKCMDTAICKGTPVAGKCPGAANIQCCVPAATSSAATVTPARPATTATTTTTTSYSPCSTLDGRHGFCQPSATCTGTRVTGRCPGSANIQCCITAAATARTTPATPAAPATPASGLGSVCHAYGKAGICQPTVSCKVGRPYPGFCPGTPATVQCCVASAPAPKVRPGKFAGKAVRKITRPAADRLAESEHQARFGDWVLKYRKRFATTQARNKAYQNFRANRIKAIKLNDSHKKGKAIFSSISPFSDIPADVFRKTKLGFRQPPASFLESESQWKPSSEEFEFALNHDRSFIEQGPVAPVNVNTNPTGTVEMTLEVDYRNLLSPMKNQQQCGSCWAHAAISTVEAQYTRLSGQPITLSAQQLVDCTSSEVHAAAGGCSGGWPNKAIDWYKTHGSCSVTEYPYAALDQTCALPNGCSGPKTTGAQSVSRCPDIPACDDMSAQDTLLAALKQFGPLSVVVDASDWQNYNGGIYPSSACKHGWMDMDHAVQLVGYGQENGKKFWLVRNSWDTWWGENGFIRIEAFSGHSCGISNNAYAALMTRESAGLPAETPAASF